MPLPHQLQRVEADNRNFARERSQGVRQTLFVGLLVRASLKLSIYIIITWKQRWHRPPTRPEWEGGRREGKVRESGMEGIKMTMVEVQVT